MVAYLEGRMNVESDQFQLFPSFSIKLVDSKKDVFVQTADMIAGTFALGYENRRRSPQYPKFHRLLKDQLWYDVDHWPANTTATVLEYARTHSVQHDEAIARFAIKAARAYCHRNSKSRNDPVARRVIFLRYLLAALTERNPTMYVTSNEIIRHLDSETGVKLTKRQLCNGIVGPLRDEGILIGSSAQGYKVPISENEVSAFIGHTALIVPPMLRRIDSCQKSIRRATEGRMDPLAGDQYGLLRRLVLACNEHPVGDQTNTTNTASTAD